MSRCRALLTSVMLSLAIVGGSRSIAHAAPDADALIERGIQLRQQGKDEEALGVFKEALALSATPRAHAQVALAEQALGMWVAAEAELIGALAANRDPWIIKNRTALEGALAVVGRHVGSLEVRGPDGAEVILDGVSIGKLPATTAFRVEAGPRILELRKPGFHASARSIEIPAGGMARAAITLAPQTADEPAPVVATPEHAPEPTRPQPVTTDSDRGHVQRILGWTFTLTGVGALAVGGVGLGVRSSIVDEYNENKDCPGLGARVQPAGCDDKVSEASTWKTVSTIALVGGGVFTIGGLALLLTAPSVPPPRASSMLSCGPNGPLGVTCAGRF